MTDTSLPSGFSALEPFVARWSVAGTANRAALRGATSYEERQAFFDAATPLLEQGLDYLDGRPLSELSAPEQRLMDIFLSLAHVAQAVETQGPDEAKGAASRQKMRITRSPADSQQQG
jgi:hypothetical protein